MIVKMDLLKSLKVFHMKQMFLNKLENKDLKEHQI